MKLIHWERKGKFKGLHLNVGLLQLIYVNSTRSPGLSTSFQNVYGSNNCLQHKAPNALNCFNTSLIISILSTDSQQELLNSVLIILTVTTFSLSFFGRCSSVVSRLCIHMNLSWFHFELSTYINLSNWII